MSEPKEKKKEKRKIQITLTPELFIRVLAIIGIIAIFVFLKIYKI